MSSYEQISIAGGDTATPLSRRKRLAIIIAHLPNPKPRILDCGCGAGEYVRMLRHSCSLEAWGVEYQLNKIVVAKQDPELAPYVEQGDIEHLRFADASFDAVLLNEVLEHVPHEAPALAEIHRILNQDGRLIVFSPNRWFPFETHGVFTKRGRKIPPYIPLIPYVPLAWGRHIFQYWARNYWQSELQNLIAQNGFEICGTDYLWQTFENISGQQPGIIRWTKPVLRLVANSFEKAPLLRRFGTTQVVVGRKLSP